MNLGAVARMLGMLLLALSLVGAVPLIVDHLGSHSIRPWLWMNGIALGAGLVLVLIGRRSASRQVGPREGAAITVGAWLALAAVAAIGLRLAIPGAQLAECWFEAMSGLTTCGASAFGERLSIEVMTPGVKLWRVLLQWMGGVGIIGLGLVLLPLIAGGASVQLFRSESSGLALGRLTPRLSDTMRFILAYNILLNLLVALALALCGVSSFDAVCHALATVSTGGFSTYDLNVAGLRNAAAEWVLAWGMLLSGINFALVVAAMRGQPRALWRSEEVRAYLWVMLVATATVAAILACSHPGYRVAPYDLIRHAFFAVVSLGTSTGFTTGFAIDPLGWGGWPPAATAVLLACSLGIGCTGSTVGGAKMLRFVLLAKIARRTLRRFAEPAMVAPVTIDSRPVHDHTVIEAAAWISCFILSLVVGTILLLLLAPLDLLSAGSMVLASLTNTGPAFGQFGPERSAQAAGPAGMVLLSLLMLIGRLEFLALLVLLSRRTWRS